MLLALALFEYPGIKKYHACETTMGKMEMQIRPFILQDIDAVITLSLKAWAPVFESLEQVMDKEVFYTLYPDWHISQREAVENVCEDRNKHVWVAEKNGVPAGFAALAFHPKDSMGEIYMIAVDPAHQRTGIGSALTEFSITEFKKAGMSIAMVATGGDPGHSPARNTYERAGFRMLPLAHYYKKL